MAGRGRVARQDKVDRPKQRVEPDSAGRPLRTAAHPAPRPLRHTAPCCARRVAATCPNARRPPPGETGPPPRPVPERWYLELSKSRGPLSVFVPCRPLSDFLMTFC